jgi:hypothetical protein
MNELAGKGNPVYPPLYESGNIIWAIINVQRLHTVINKSVTMDTNFMVCKKHIIIYINKGLSAGGD